MPFIVVEYHQRFRLLSELYSLLLEGVLEVPFSVVPCFRLLSELYSLLLIKVSLFVLEIKIMFPSPLGVIFSLMSANS